MGYFEIAHRWIEVNTTNPSARNLRHPKFFFEGPRIFSYGHHFEMARALKDKRGVTRMFLVNGETASMTTSRHQSQVRAAIQRSGVPSVIIPYGAMEAAGIDLDTVEVLERSEDRFEETYHEVWERPEGSRWQVQDVCDYVELTDEEVEALLARKNASALDTYESGLRRSRENLTLDPDRYASTIEWSRKQLARAEAEGPPKPLTRDSLSTYEGREYRVIAQRKVLLMGRSTWRTIDVDYVDGRWRYSWTTRRHWLGESLIRARVHFTRQHVCRACTGSGLHPDAPPEPRRGIGWDQYPTPLTFEGQNVYRDEIRETWATWYRAWGPGGTGDDNQVCARCAGRGRWITSHTRTAKFLSGFDRNESRPSYFFCELPRTRAVTIEDALEALKPDTVRLAEQMGREVRRQGDIFAVEMAGLTKRSLRKMGATFTKMGRLFGTNHAATEVAVLPNGTHIARGCIRHVPEFGRRPDHARINLGDGWKVIVKNTVPLAA